MAKKLSDVLKGTNSSKVRAGSTGTRPGVDYAGKMKDERDFVAAHTTQEFEDRVGNGSDVFNATNIKHQPDDKHGHIPKPKDETQYKLNNEEKEDQKHEEKEMMKRQLHFIKYAADEIMGHVNDTKDPEEWFQNKLAATHEQIRGLHSYIEGDKRLKAEKGEMKESVEKADQEDKSLPGDPRVQPKDVKGSGKKLSLILDKNKKVNESQEISRTKTDSEQARARFMKKIEKKEEKAEEAQEKEDEK